MTATTKARHRKATRALTPLSEVAPSTRLGLAVAATSGLAIAMVGSGAAVAASTATEVGESAGSLEAGIGALAAPAREAVATNEAITVAADAQWQGPAAAEVAAEAPPAPQPKAEEPKEETKTESTTERATAASESSSNRRQASRQSNSSQSESTPAPSKSSQEIPASAAGSNIVAIASQYLGVPYVYGGTSPSGFDCSGLVQYVYRQAGISLPRTSYAQGAAGTRVSAAQAQPGDIVYYGYHVGIYIGNGKMIHAPRPGDVVKVAAVYDSPSYIRIG
ncbi:Probable endopeptidase p60 precursor [Actinomyces bovis]|uniref:Probable endopeptidase p60 n=1 Tax=Actinomyces bovis TaxID=1658 RepID=A0ABY1VQZ1_9ACTO|nr:C40 family peptidase [Actinomyces bovis]SPT54233.1 Probable endopeptidase p60 precursor [Actinomyces bovis]VEG56488.1 Probable endopeptidase p60 precursor [Actinomyces israelii]